MITKVEMFTVDCDNCGKNADENTDYSCWGDEAIAVDVAKNSDWHVEDDKHYCPDCFSFDDEDNLILTTPKTK